MEAIATTIAIRLEAIATRLETISISTEEPVLQRSVHCKFDEGFQTKLVDITVVDPDCSASEVGVHRVTCSPL